MDLLREAPADRQFIQSYRNGRFRVSGVVYQGSVIVMPARTILWPGAAVAPVTAADVAPPLAEAAGLEICLLGCGARMAPLSDEVRAAFKAAGLSVDAMATGAACRTFNVLVAEGRAVMAALIAL